jgi:hypothetical protein
LLYRHEWIHCHAKHGFARFCEVLRKEGAAVGLRAPVTSWTKKAEGDRIDWADVKDRVQMSCARSTPTRIRRSA